MILSLPPAQLGKLSHSVPNQPVMRGTPRALMLLMLKPHPIPLQAAVDGIPCQAPLKVSVQSDFVKIPRRGPYVSPCTNGVLPWELGLRLELLPGKQQLFLEQQSLQSCLLIGSQPVSRQREGVSPPAHPAFLCRKSCLESINSPPQRKAFLGVCLWLFSHGSHRDLANFPLAIGAFCFCLSFSL